MKLSLALLVVVIACVALANADKPESCTQQMAKNGNGVIQCMGYMKVWTYDAQANECVEFIYGGCQGNSNRFDTQELCAQTCVS